MAVDTIYQWGFRLKTGISCVFRMRYPLFKMDAITVKKPQFRYDLRYIRAAVTNPYDPAFG